MNMIQSFVQQAIRDHPEAAAREVPEILETYATDNTKLNRVKDAAKSLIAQIDKGRLVDDHGHDFNRNVALIGLRRAVAEAEGVTE
jgi:hypothetical protein